MISSTNRGSCSQLVAGKCDVIVGEPPTCQRSVMTDFLERFEHHESELADAPDSCGYANEFRLLKEFSKHLKEDKANLQEGEQEFNLRKNRYKDILPFSHTRVILSSDPEVPGSCYINANYVRGPSGSPRAYIACQGPLACTLADFWRMIWECSVSVIVMACNEHESGKPKCELYWPQDLDTSEIYGDFQVTYLRARQFCPDFLIRKFSIKYLVPTKSELCENGHYSEGAQQASKDDILNNNNGILEDDDDNDTEIRPKSSLVRLKANNDQRFKVLERVVCQFHYTTWPDHGVPDSVQPILELIRLIREVQPEDEKPVLVHCSAGCGRTGTICCIDYVWGLFRRGKLDADFDLCNIISEMRQQRMAMVQTLEQYVLCHRAVAALFIQQLKLMNGQIYDNLDSMEDYEHEVEENEDENDKTFGDPEDLGPLVI